MGLPVWLVRRLLPQRQYFGRQSWLLQCEPVLCRQRCRTPALSETPRSPAVAAPDMSLMSAIGVKRTSRGQAAMSANDPKRSTNRCDKQKAGRRRRDLRRARTVPMTARPCKRSTARYGRENTTVQRPESAIEFPIGRLPVAIQGVQKRHPGATEQLTLFGAAIIVLLIFVWSYV